MLKQIVGAILTIVGVAVAIHTVVEPLYHVSTDEQLYSSFWGILNPLMVLSIILGLIFGYIRKKNLEGGDAITREYLAANIQFYGLLFVGIMFFWNYFNYYYGPKFIAIGADTQSLVWILIDASLPLLLGAMGISLLRSNDE